MAQSYAQTDPSAAAAWVEQYRTETAYPTAVAQIAQSLARFDAPAAAAVLDRLDASDMADPQQFWGASRSIGMAWARTDPPAAADWARRVSTDGQRSMALGAVTEVWAGNDYAAARSWTLRLPVGQPRDSALGALLANARTTSDLDTNLLGAFSTEAARQNSTLNAVYRIAQRSPTDARLIAERHLTSPEQCQQAERGIAQVERELSGGQPIFFSD
jgi:hypothetical protein